MVRQISELQAVLVICSIYVGDQSLKKCHAVAKLSIPTKYFAAVVYQYTYWLDDENEAKPGLCPVRALKCYVEMTAIWWVNGQQGSAD